MFIASAFREHTSPKVQSFFAYVLHFQENSKIYLFFEMHFCICLTLQDPEAFLIIFVTEKMDLPYQNKKNTASVLVCLLTLS